MSGRLRVNRRNLWWTGVSSRLGDHPVGQRGLVPIQHGDTDYITIGP